MLQKIRLFLVSMLLCQYSLSAQSTTGVGGVSSNPASVSYKVNTAFNLSMSLSYNTIDYQNYQIQILLPAGGVSWSMDANNIILKENSANISIGTVQVDGSNPNLYLIPLNITATGRNGIVFAINGFTNLKSSTCIAPPSQSTIQFTLVAKNKSSSANESASSTTTVVTPLLDQTTGSYNLGISGTQETVVSTTSGVYPYVATLSASASNVATFPGLKLTYNATNLDFITAVKYSTSPSLFHTSVISVTPVSGVITWDAQTVSDLLNGQYYIKVYFKPKANLAVGAVTFSGTGGTYATCSGSTTFSDQSLSNTALNLQTATTLLQGFNVGDDNSYFCSQNCDFDPNAIPTNKFYFESNNLYNATTTVPPGIEVQCPGSGIKVLNLQLTTAQYTGNSTLAVTYTIVGDAHAPYPLTGTVVGLNTVYSFTGVTGTINKIYIAGYDETLYNKAKDFVIEYRSLSATTANLPTFSVKYTNFANSYNSRGMTNATYFCNPNLYLYDYYSKQASFSLNGGVSTFQSNEMAYVAIQIYQPDKYAANYTINNLGYALDNNMVFSSSQVLFTEGDGTVLSNYKALTTNGTNFKQILVNMNAAKNALNISFQVNGGSPCVAGKTLYLLLKVQVKNNTSFNSDYYHAVSNNGGQPVQQVQLAYWNLTKEFENVKADISMTCSGQDFYNATVKQGDVISMKYSVQNVNNSPISKVVLQVPATIGIADIYNSGQILGKVYELRGGVATDLSTQNYVTASLSADGLSYLLSTVNGYVLMGKRQLVVEVKYRVKTTATIGTQSTGLAVNILQVYSQDGTIQVNPRITVGGVDVYQPIGGTNTVNLKVGTTTVCPYDNSDCAECVTSLSPLPGHQYLLSAWVKEPFTDKFPDTYKNTGIKITFNDGAIADLDLFRPTGPIIDGWQRIDTFFVVPVEAKNIGIELVNLSVNNDAFFDDIRLHPFRSNMKSFVYDPSSQRLLAELDENNYATLYEYDDEGILVRVKKETERGVMTIKESRNNQSKINK